jgi:flagellar FliL protein
MGMSDTRLDRAPPLAITVAALALLTGVFSPSMSHASEEKHAKPEAKAEGHGAAAPTDVYFKVPDIVVNLNNTGRSSPSFLKISILIEVVHPEDMPAIEKVMPRIVDNFQVYLRELRLADLRGTSGIYRLREELLLRVAAAAKPVQVKDVLFREMLIQ